MTGSDHRSFFRADRGILRMNDVKADLCEVKAEEIHIDLEAADLFCNLGVLDAGFEGLEILSGDIHHKGTKSTK